jgi:alpha-mannosidase
VFRGEMVRGTKSTSVKVVTDTTVDSLHYPPPGIYTFKYSITSGSGDWRANKSYRAGLNFNNPLIPVSVVDDISRKSLPASQSFLESSSDGTVLSAIKKAGREPNIIFRWYENEGKAANLSVRFLGKPIVLERVNLLEEPAGGSLGSGVSLNPYQIKTVRSQRLP